MNFFFGIIKLKVWYTHDVIWFLKCTRFSNIIVVWWKKVLLKLEIIQHLEREQIGKTHHSGAIDCNIIKSTFYVACQFMIYYFASFIPAFYFEALIFIRIMNLEQYLAKKKYFKS